MRSTIEQAPSRAPASVPPGAAPRRRRATGLFVAAAVATVLALLAGSIYVVEQRRIADRDDRIAALTTELGDAAGASHVTVDRLNQRIARLEARHTADDARIRDLEAQLLAVGGPPLADGRHFGYISAAVGGQNPRVVVDVALFLTDEAAAAAHGGQLEDGYYVVNDNPEIRTVSLSPDATVWIVGPNTNAEPTIQVPLQEWIDAVTSATNLNSMSYIDNGYWFDLVDGRVVRLEEQWVP
jgi:hypothetical protein